MRPEVSILIPVRNEEPFISDCLDSIKNQTFEDWELVIIDDHSTDKTAFIIQKYLVGDNRIRLFRNEGSGLIDALKTGFHKVRGTYLTRMDGDDIMPVNWLKKMVEAIEGSPGNTIITGLIKYFPQAGVSEGYKKYENWLNDINLHGNQWKNIYRECIVAAPNWMGRTADLKKIDGFDHLEYPDDYHLAFKWYKNRFNIKCVPEITLKWREHENRASKLFEGYNQESFFKLKIGQFLALDDKKGDLLLWGTNTKGKITAKLLDNHKRDFHWMDIPSQEKMMQGKNITCYKEMKSLIHRKF